MLCVIINLLGFLFEVNSVLFSPVIYTFNNGQKCVQYMYDEFVK
jgi:hypothetical protein